MIKVWVEFEKSRTFIAFGGTFLAIEISEHEVTVAEKKAIERWHRSPNRWSAGVLECWSAGVLVTITQGRLTMTTVLPGN